MSRKNSSKTLGKKFGASHRPSSSVVNTLDNYFTPTTRRSTRKRRVLATSQTANQENQMFCLESPQSLHTTSSNDQWLPIEDVDSSGCLITTRTLTPSPFSQILSAAETSRSNTSTSLSNTSISSTLFKFNNLFTNQSVGRARTPLPPLKWGDPVEVWQVMKKKEVAYTRDANVLRRHPHLQSRMRAILLDWIIEVCEVYRLHRETFHLALDFIDRYLSTQINVQKSQLQLLGVTSLFIAAKLEEIYPPKIGDFAYVTDGACTECDIASQELVILKALHWDLTPMTVNMWMCVYLQLLHYKEDTSHGEETTLTQPQYTGHVFVQAARLMDLCLLDVGSLQFPYSKLAASVLYHFSDEKSTYKASGYSWEELVACISWMSPFAITVRDSPSVHMRTFENVMFSDCHNIQTHTVDLDMLVRGNVESRHFSKSLPAVGVPADDALGRSMASSGFQDNAQRRQRDMQRSHRCSSPQRRAVPDTILTPPSSSRKPRILRS